MIARRLTSRQSEVVVLLMQGYGNGAIAARLVIERDTVKNHLSKVCAALGFCNRVQVAVWFTLHPEQLAV